jgi:hypothetical protein
MASVNGDKFEPENDCFLMPKIREMTVTRPICLKGVVENQSAEKLDSMKTGFRPQPLPENTPQKIRLRTHHGFDSYISSRTHPFKLVQLKEGKLRRAPVISHTASMQLATQNRAILALMRLNFLSVRDTSSIVDATGECKPVAFSCKPGCIGASTRFG